MFISVNIILEKYKIIINVINQIRLILAETRFDLDAVKVVKRHFFLLLHVIFVYLFLELN